MCIWLFLWKLAFAVYFLNSLTASSFLYFTGFSFFLHNNHITHLIPVILPQLLLFPCNLLFPLYLVQHWNFVCYFFLNYIFMCFCPASQLNFNSQRQNYFYFIPSFSLVHSLCQACFETSNTYWIFNLYISSISHDIQGP